MKKLLISLSAIVMLVAGATVASAAGGYIVDYNEDLSVAGEKAVIDVYLDVENDGSGFAALACQLALYDGDTKVSADYIESVECTPYGNLTVTQVKYNASQGLMMVTGSGTSTTALQYDENRQLATFTLTLKQALKDGLKITRLAGRDTSYTPFVNGVKQTLVKTSDLDEYATIVVAPAGPTTETITATQEPYAAVKPGDVLNEESAQAVAYWAQSTFTSGQTAYWTATINTAPKKKEISLANVSGTAKLGIVITGATSVEDVKLNVVTPAAN